VFGNKRTQHQTTQRSRRRTRKRGTRSHRQDVNGLFSKRSIRLETFGCTTSIFILQFAMTTKHKSNEEKAEQRIEKVVHNYHDYSNEAEKAEESIGDLQQMEEHPQSAMNRGEQNFPVKLHYMLNELEKDGMDGIVSWQPHGRCFLVHKQQLFVEQVLPL
jgi:hypothetical protein